MGDEWLEESASSMSMTRKVNMRWETDSVDGLLHVLASITPASNNLVDGFVDHDLCDETSGFVEEVVEMILLSEEGRLSMILVPRLG